MTAYVPVDLDSLCLSSSEAGPPDIPLESPGSIVFCLATSLFLLSLPEDHCSGRPSSRLLLRRSVPAGLSFLRGPGACAQRAGAFHILPLSMPKNIPGGPGSALSPGTRRFLTSKKRPQWGGNTLKNLAAPVKLVLLCAFGFFFCSSGFFSLILLLLNLLVNGFCLRDFLPIQIFPAPIPEELMDLGIQIFVAPLPHPEHGSCSLHSLISTRAPKISPPNRRLRTPLVSFLYGVTPPSNPPLFHLKANLGHPSSLRQENTASGQVALFIAQTGNWDAKGLCCCRSPQSPCQKRAGLRRFLFCSPSSLPGKDALFFEGAGPTLPHAADQEPFMGDFCAKDTWRFSYCFLAGLCPSPVGGFEDVTLDQPARKLQYLVQHGLESQLSASAPSPSSFPLLLFPKEVLPPPTYP